jgi:predicted nucleic acid-binding protein
VSRSLLLDTNILIDAERGHKPTIQFLRSIEEDDLAISLITYGELLQGALWSKNSPTAILKLERSIAKMEHLPITKLVMARYAFLRGNLQKIGRSIAAADAMIAATAIESGRILVTRNVRHFEAIEILDVIDPGDTFP